MKSYSLKDEFRSSDVVWADGVLPQAGIYFLEGQCHVASLTSTAERRLLERGALLVAVLTFDGSSPDAPVAGGTDRPLGELRPLTARDAVQRLGWGPSRN